MANKNHSYAKIITTISLALFALFWTTIDGQLKALDMRLRCVEQQIAAISARLGVEKEDLSGSQTLPAGPPAAAGRPETGAMGGTIP